MNHTTKVADVTDLVAKAMNTSPSILKADGWKTIIAFNYGNPLLDLIAIIHVYNCCGGIRKTQFAHSGGEFLWRPEDGLDQLDREIAIYKDWADKQAKEFEKNAN